MNRALREHVRAWVERTAGYPAVWADAPVPFVSPDDSRADRANCALLVLTIVTSLATGVDEIRRESLASPTRITETAIGQRAATLAIRCECYDPDYEAVDILEDLRSDTRYERVRVDLARENVAIVDCMQVNDLANEIDTRVVSTANLDMHLAWARGASDTRTNPAWIETIDVEYET